MLNQVILVGRLTSDPELVEHDNGKVLTRITLAVQRPYKNAETGNYDTDFVDCTLWEGIAKNTVDYCKKGDVIGVKARLQKYLKEIEGKNYSMYNVVADKITFISSNK